MLGINFPVFPSTNAHRPPTTLNKNQPAFGGHKEKHMLSLNTFVNDHFQKDTAQSPTSDTTHDTALTTDSTAITSATVEPRSAYSTAPNTPTEDLTLLNAIYSQDAPLIKAQLKAGVDVNQHASNGWTPLMQAAAGTFQNDLHNLVDMLLYYDPDVDLQDEYQSTATMEAVRADNIQALRKLLKRSPDLNKTDIDGKTALNLAAEQENVEAASMLMEHGADPNIQDHNAKRPIDWAIENKDYRLFELLAKPKPEHPKHEQLKAEATQKLAQLEQIDDSTIASTLKSEYAQKLAKLEKVDDYKSASKLKAAYIRKLDEMEKKDDAQIAAELKAERRQKLADLQKAEDACSLKADYGHALDALDEIENPEVAATLATHILAAGINVLKPDELAKVLSFKPNLDVQGKVDERGVKVSPDGSMFYKSQTCVHNGSTPLIRAAAKGNITAVKQLVEAGASLSLSDGSGAVAESHARGKHHYAIEAYLKEKNAESANQQSDL